MSASRMNSRKPRMSQMNASFASVQSISSVFIRVLIIHYPVIIISSKALHRKSKLGKAKWFKEDFLFLRRMITFMTVKGKSFYENHLKDVL